MKGMPNFVKNHAVTYFCHLCDFMIGLIGKPKLCTKFQIASFSHCINIKGNPKFLGASQTGHAHFCLSVWFCNGTISNLKSLASTSTEILKGPQILGSSCSSELCHFFFWVWFYDGPWQTPDACPKIESYLSQWAGTLFLVGIILRWAFAGTSCLPNFNSLTSAIAKILKENPEFWGAPLAQCEAHFFGFDFMMGLGKPQLHANYAVASFGRCRYIIGEPQNIRERC